MKNYITFVTIASCLMLLSIQSLANDKSIVAIMDFKNNGMKDYDYLQASLANMLSTTLATSEKIQIVEREQLEKIVSEMKIGMTGLIDPEKVAQIGKLAGANMVVLGSFTNLGKALRIDVKIVNVETGIIVPKATASTKVDNIENVDVAIDQLAKGLLTNLTGEIVIQGDPSKMGYIYLSLSDSYALGIENVLRVFVDDLRIKYDDEHKIIIEVNHGKHKVTIKRDKGIARGGFKTESDTTITVPGGYYIRVDYKSKTFNVIGTYPLPIK